MLGSSRNLVHNKAHWFFSSHEFNILGWVSWVFLSLHSSKTQSLAIDPQDYGLGSRFQQLRRFQAFQASPKLDKFFWLKKKLNGGPIPASLIHPFEVRPFDPGPRWPRIFVVVYDPPHFQNGNKIIVDWLDPFFRYSCFMFLRPRRRGPNVGPTGWILSTFLGKF